MTQAITTLPELTSALVGRGFHRVEGDTLIAPNDQFPDPGCWSYREDQRLLFFITALPAFDFVEKPFPIVVRCIHAPDSDQMEELFIGTFTGDAIAWAPWLRLSLPMILQVTTGLVRAWLISETEDSELMTQFEETP